MTADRRDQGERGLREDVARAETALRESEQRFRSVVHGAPDGVAILRGPTILYLNPRAARLLGLARPEDGYGRPITDFIHPEDQAAAGERIRELLRTGNPHDQAYEYRSRAVEGRELTVEISSILIDFDGGRAVLAFARDVTERKALQTRLAQADRLAALGMLSAGVAHEINNPLAYVLMNLELMSRELSADGPADKATLLARLREAQHGGERVATIVRDLKTLAREDQAVHWPVQLESVLDTALNVARAEIERHGRVERRYAELPAVAGIAARLEQVFVNLLSNAAHALSQVDGHGGVVTLAASADAEWVTVTVSDTGVGMTEDVKRHIFDPFFTTKPAGVGTGLGLPICQGIVSAHGGSIDVVTEPGRGSSFSVKLRRYHGATEVPAPREPAPPSGRARVLIVDDDVAVGRTLRLALEEDHDVTVVASASEALGILRAPDAERYDAVLCDLLMPGMTGGELFSVTRAERPELARRFVFMSGGYFGENEPAPTGDQPVLEKPFNLEQVREVLRDALRRPSSAAPSVPG